MKPLSAVKLFFANQEIGRLHRHILKVRKARRNKETHRKVARGILTLRTVLDSRFIVEYFYSDETETKQKATKKLKEIIQHKEGVSPTIIISETIQTVSEQIGKDEAEICYANLTQSGLKIQSLTSAIAKEAGLLRSKHCNIPMGDCIIAATALANGAKISSDDPSFDCIREIKRIWI